MKLALGTVQFGLNYGIANHTGQVALSGIKAMLGVAAARGVRTLDTAAAYGESEANLGQAGVTGFQVVTKLSALPEGCQDPETWVLGQVRGSLARIGVTELHGLLLHRPGQLLEEQGRLLLHALLTVKELGLARKIGVSVYGPEELTALLAAGPIDLVQAPFNLLDRRMQASGWLARLKDRGIEVHTRSAFLQGLLLMDRKAIPEGFRRWDTLWDTWSAWLATGRCTPLQACLALPLSLPEIDRVVVGADNLEQLNEILDAATARIPVDLPEIASDEEDLINPARWRRS